MNVKKLVLHHEEAIVKANSTKNTFFKRKTVLRIDMWNIPDIYPNLLYPAFWDVDAFVGI